ncbi:MAG TPA: M15 family metallopeptidase [Acidimicrobiia bacterium]|jgi:hypothetical protein
MSFTLAACSGGDDHTDARRTTRAEPTTTAPSVTEPTTTSPTTTSANFAASVDAVTADDLPSTYREGCPVPPEALRRVHVSFWGFDGSAHEGNLVVAADVTDDVVTVFRQLFDERFPIRSITPEDAFGGSDPDSMAADNTSAFNCRDAVAAGPPQWSEHAFGRAVDVNPLENPYVFEGTAQPSAGASFLDRAAVRPGMAVPGGPLVEAFQAVGWEWGGAWDGSPDYQHFSPSGG